MLSLLLRRLRNRTVGSLVGARVPIWYDPRYRLPIAGLRGATGLEPRRADYVLWYLLSMRVVRPTSVRRPQRICYAHVARVHTEELLDGLARPEELAQVFHTGARDLPVDEVLRSVRLMAGGTLEAAREARRRRGPALNLAGGMHHASPARATGFCPINDIAIAVAALRAEGLRGTVAVLDLDAHPPDGTAACLAEDPAAWVGSISGTAWDAPSWVDEVPLPGGNDATYLAALRRLLRRMPKAALVFVLAGGDVLAGDRLGGLALTLDGVRRRDLIVAERLGRTPSVWLPGGGYSRGAWKVLAGTALALEQGTRRPLPERFEPMRARFSQIARSLAPADLGAEDDSLNLTEADVAEALGMASSGPPRLLGFYTEEGLELAFARYGVLEQLRRMGYGPFRVEISRDGVGDRSRLYGMAEGREYLLTESVLAIEDVGRKALYVHWLSLMNPRAEFQPDHPRLPGQERPGLGLAREATELLGRMATRLGLAGIAFRPAWYHIAYVARRTMRFADPARQGRFLALMRDLQGAGLSLLEATQAVAEGRVWRDGLPYTWEADLMVNWAPEEDDEALVEAARDRTHFLVRDAPAKLEPGDDEDGQGA